jgi:hypothetical protein
MVGYGEKRRREMKEMERARGGESALLELSLGASE